MSFSLLDVNKWGNVFIGCKVSKEPYSVSARGLNLSRARLPFFMFIFEPVWVHGLKNSVDFLQPTSVGV
jgi:hypothetical protein